MTTRLLSALVVTAVLAGLIVPSLRNVASGAPVVILGDSVVEPTPDASDVGTVEANRFIATANGVVSSLAIYLDQSNAATFISLGLYSDASGSPGTLLAQGSIANPVAGAWNSVGVASTSLASGAPYWIARLANAGGPLVSRIDATATDPDMVDGRTLSTFPATFSPGASYPHRTSMTASTAGDPTPTPTPSPPPSPTPTAPPFDATVAVDGAQRFQSIDGFGVNAISKTWQGGSLRPAIDMLVDAGASIWRVDVHNGHSDWESTNDNADPLSFDWSVYNAIYSTPEFEDLWSLLSYLNAKGVTVELSLSGTVPDFMGTSEIFVSAEDEFVEEVTSLAYYARNTRGIGFRFLSPFNEIDAGPPEGPAVPSDQAARILGKLASRLDSLGMSDVRLIGPDTTGINQDYTYAMMGDPAVMAHLGAFAYHRYTWCCASDAAALIAASSYPDSHFWISEWNQCDTDGCLIGGQPVADEWAFASEMTSQLLTHLEGGASAALAWDAWDNWHEHTPCCAIDHWGELYQDASGIYHAKKRLLTNETVFRFVRQGMVRLGATTSDPTLTATAFSSSAGALTIAGRNQGGSSRVAGSIANGPSVSSLALYVTSATQDLVRLADVPVSGGTFSVTIPANSFFTLTTLATAPPPPTPTPTPNPTPTPPGPTPTPVPGALLLGDTVIEPASDPSGVGDVEANQFTAIADGSATTLWIYLDASNSATTIGLALYADSAGVPGALLAQGTRAGAQSGAWNAVTIPGTSLRAGTRYWIARLAMAGGNLVTRVNSGTTDPDFVDSRSMTSFPATFSAGASYPHRTSMYATAGAAGPTPTPTPLPTPSPTPTPSPSPTPIPTPSPAPTPTAVPTPTPTPPVQSTTVTFDDLTNPDRALDGQYGGIDWGTGAWYLSSPWGSFTTNSVSYPSSAPRSANLTFAIPRVLLSLDAYNGGASASTVSLSCTGSPTVTQIVGPGQNVTIATGWSATCATLTIGSSNGWFTNFDNLTYR